MPAREVYAFGDVTLDVGERRLSKAGEPVRLAPKALDLLVHLVRHAGRLGTKRELLDEVWAGSFVEEGILAVHVSSLRKALGDAGDAPRYIETVPRAGYRFIASVTGVDGGMANDDRRPVRLPPEVHELLGRGRSHLLAASRSEVPHAIAAYRKAIELAPTLAAAQAGLARACCAEAELRLAPPAEAYARAGSAALAALGLDDACGDAHLALGTVLFLGNWHWIAAERSLRRALEIMPASTEVALTYGRLLDALGRSDDALDVKLRALEHDPFSPAVHLGISMSYWHRRRYDDAIAWANRTIDLDPAHMLAREHLAGAYWKLGDFDRHMAEGVKHARAAGVPDAALEPMAQVYAAAGRPGIVRWVLDQAAAGAAFPDAQLALLHGEAGEMDAAIRHLDRALDAHDPCLVDLAVGPQWDHLRADPRFDACLARMGLGPSGGSSAPAAW